MRKFRFYKDEEGSWFVDLPEWKGAKEDLEMVAGADTMLDFLAKQKEEIFLWISETQFPESFRLKFLREEPAYGGGWYILERYKGRLLLHELWLCEVTRFVFDKLPKEIFIGLVRA